MFQWLFDAIFAHMTDPPESQIGRCVTTQLIAEIERLQQALDIALMQRDAAWKRLDERMKRAE